MAKAIDLKGQRIGRLVVIEFDKITVAPNGRTTRFWKCACDCGNVISVRTSSLKDGNTKSCGCLKKDLVSQVNYKHGQKGTRLYRIWGTMKKRCYYPKHKNYMNYGGRGITICEEWLGEHGFENFASWALNNGYSDELTIDRIDNRKGYSPENCRWATATEQQNNRRNNVKYFYEGKSLSAKEWANTKGIPLRTLLNRLYIQKWSIERALTEPLYKSNQTAY